MICNRKLFLKIFFNKNNLLQLNIILGYKLLRGSDLWLVIYTCTKEPPIFR